MKPIKKPGIKRRTKKERSAHLDFIARAVLKGWTLKEVAEYLDLDPSMVSKEFAKVRENWRKRQDRNIAEIEAMELDRLDLIERESWQAWAKSLQEQKVKIIRQIRDEGMDKNRQYVEQRLSEATGNPRYLEVVLKASQDRRTMLGIPNTEQSRREALENMSHQMLRMVQMMAEAEGLAPGPTQVAVPKSNGQDHDERQPDELE